MDTAVGVDAEAEEEMQLNVDDESAVYTEDTVFVQEGQLVLPFTGRTVVLQDGDGNYQQYIINDSTGEKPDDEQSIIYYTGDYSENDDSKIVIESEFQQPLYQYAILSNGKLHLQTIDASNELTVIENEGLQEQIEALQQSIKLEEPVTESPMDLDKITGRNLITGQTVTLDSYFNKLQKRLSTNCNTGNVNKRRSSEENELINKRVVIGKMANGKKVVGKILHVQTNKNLEVAVDENVTDTSTETAEPNEVSQPQIIIKKHMVTRENFDSNIGKTLAGLMDLETVQHKLRNKNLVVKLVDKLYEFGTENFSKTISYVYGHMEMVEEGEEQVKWCFVLHNEPLNEEGDNTEADSTDVSLQMEDNETVSVTILTVIDKNGKKSTRVNLNPQQLRNKCHLCSKEFKTALQVRKHISNVHLSEKWVSCDVCGKTFTNAAFLQRHKKIHTREKWYHCPKCPKSFNTAGSLKRHLTVHDPSLRPLECSVCVQRFTDESSLRKHLLIHTGIRAYVCKVCNRAFRNQGDLNFHRRIHDPIKQFSCDVCGRAFSRHSNMVRHAEIHRGTGALHQCHICGCSYSFISSLTRHIVQKHISEQQQQ